MRLTKPIDRVRFAYAKTTRNRPIVVRCRAALGRGAAQAQRRQAPRARPRCTHKHPVCAQDGHSVGDGAPRDGMRIGNDLCWRRLEEWHELGVWERLHRTLLDRLGQAEKIDWERASLDSAAVPAPGGRKTGPNPTDRGKQGSKRHLVVDCQGVPLALKHSAANVHDSKMLEEEVVDAIGPVRGPQGRPGEGHASVPRSSTPTRARTSPGVGRHSASGASRVAHSQEGHRLQRAARASSMGGGADAFVAEALSAAGGALRAAG
jgi:transposase